MERKKLECTNNEDKKLDLIIKLNEYNREIIKTGIKELDEVIGGFHNSDLIVVASRPAMGKTSFASNIASSVVKEEKIPVAVFSLEMSKEQIIDKLKLREKDIADFLYINDTPAISIAEIKSISRNLKLEKNIGLIIIDYIQLITSSKKNTNREQEIAEISMSLKMLAKELDIPVIAVSQLSKEPDLRANHRPMMTDFNNSCAVAQNSDIVMFLYREDYYAKSVMDIEITEVIIAKNKYGKYGTVNLHIIQN